MKITIARKVQVKDISENTSFEVFKLKTVNKNIIKLIAY